MLIIVKTTLSHGIIIMHSKNWNKGQAKRINKDVPCGVDGDDHFDIQWDLLVCICH